MLLLLFALTLLSAFFSGSEAAIFSQDIGRLKRGLPINFSANLRKLVSGWLKRSERIITGLLLGNLFVNIAITNLSEIWISREFPPFPHRTIILPIVITLYVLTFGEVVPKIIALVFKDAWVKFCQLPLRGWFRITNRITKPVDKLASIVVKPLKPVRNTLSEQELIEAVRFAEQHSLVRDEEMRMLSRSIAFYHNTLYSAMIPRSQLLLLPKGRSLASYRRSFANSAHSFAVMYRRDAHNIEGVIYLRGLVQVLLSQKKKLEQKIYPIAYLPASMPLSGALSMLIGERRDLAAVVDEAGAFIGMVTIRAIIDNILGSSFSAAPRDEYLERLDTRRFRVSAQMPLDRFNEIFRTAFVARQSETIGGYIIEHLDGFPRRGDEFEVFGLYFSGFVIDDYKLQSFILRQ